MVTLGVDTDLPEATVRNVPIAEDISGAGVLREGLKTIASLSEGFQDKSSNKQLIRLTQQYPVDLAEIRNNPDLTPTEKRNYKRQLDSRYKASTAGKTGWKSVMDDVINSYQTEISPNPASGMVEEIDSVTGEVLNSTPMEELQDPEMLLADQMADTAIEFQNFFTQSADTADTIFASLSDKGSVHLESVLVFQQNAAQISRNVDMAIDSLGARIRTPGIFAKDRETLIQQTETELSNQLENLMGLFNSETVVGIMRENNGVTPDDIIRLRQTMVDDFARELTEMQVGRLGINVAQFRKRAAEDEDRYADILRRAMSGDVKTAKNEADLLEQERRIRKERWLKSNPRLETIANTSEFLRDAASVMQGISSLANARGTTANRLRTEVQETLQETLFNYDQLSWLEQEIEDAPMDSPKDVTNIFKRIDQHLKRGTQLSLSVNYLEDYFTNTLYPSIERQVESGAIGQEVGKQRIKEGNRLLKYLKNVNSRAGVDVDDMRLKLDSVSLKVQDAENGR